MIGCGCMGKDGASVGDDGEEEEYERDEDVWLRMGTKVRDMW